ncbi:hypothetical protein C0V75_18020 [Tabrizicola sp. TH137]|uniref:type III secretion system translocon subunit SctE n=1 Tax=Tabrizicola sp. TH137 TaxID=2067452 RepID=UPI000C7A94FF|nr:type III secretion system translocon subunit SctE [Tabrizicola sp. TH137]PLL11177.1 hypothetical protein C0V75_18020 [Tabrizicola sp. TH137]
MNTPVSQPTTRPGTIGQTGTSTGGVTQSSQTSQTQTTTGTGVIGSVGPVPDQASPVYTNLIQQLRSFLPNTTVDDFEAMLAKATSKLKDAITTVQEGRANNEMESKRVSIKENEAKIDESKKKLDEAEAKRNSGNIFDILSLVFQAIGAALLTALGAALMATGVGGGLGGMLLASGIMMMVSFVNSVTSKENEGAGILGSIVKAAGGDDKAVMAADGAFAAAMLIAAIAMIPVAAKAVPATVADMSAKLSKMAETLGRTLASILGEVLTKVTQAAKPLGLALQTVTSTLDAGTQIGSSGMGLAATIDKNEATKLRAESTEIQAMMQQLDDIIDMALTLLMQINGNMQGMLDQLSDMMKDTGDTLSNTRFAG